MRVTWAKNKNGDGYILRIVMGANDPDVKPGTDVTVSKKDGTAVKALVETVLWCGAPGDIDRDMDQTLREDDMIVLATAVPPKKRSAREMARDKAAGKGASAQRPAFTEPGPEDDIPF